MSRVIVGEALETKNTNILDGVDGKSKPTKSDSYLERVVKYIPAEVVAFFVFVNSLVAGLAKEPLASLEANANSEAIINKLRETPLANDTISLLAVSNATLLVGACMAVVYLMLQHDPKKGNEYIWLNAIVSFVGFFVWAYAVDAVALRPWHDGVLASILLACFSLISGAISPSAQDVIVNKLGSLKDATLGKSKQAE